MTRYALLIKVKSNQARSLKNFVSSLTNIFVSPTQRGFLSMYNLHDHLYRCYALYTRSLTSLVERMRLAPKQWSVALNLYLRLSLQYPVPAASL